MLFYRLVGDHVEEMLPIVYTPTVGAAIEEFSHLFRRPRGLFLNVDDVDGIERALEDTRLGPDDVDLIVASDGEAILGIGDWGVGGVDISIGKLAVYTVAAGIDPSRVLAVGLDVGTNREQLLTDPRYLGLRRSRARGDEYDAFIDAYVAAASKHFPNAILHWEDFSGPQARGILERYGDTLCTFDDDVQGTASIGLACVLSGVRVAGGRLTDQEIVIFGGGAAGIGIADLIAHAMSAEGLSAQEAADHIWIIDRPGLLTSDMDGLYDYQRPYAKDPAKVAGWRVRQRRPRPRRGRREPASDDARRHLGRHRRVHRGGRALDARALRAADRAADVQPDGAGRADAREPAGLDGRRRRSSRPAARSGPSISTARRTGSARPTTR